jgi:hypothetical protein
VADLRLVEPTIDTYGSRRAWKRHRRAMHEQQWSHRSVGGGEQRGPSVGAVALASVAILAVVLVLLLISQVAAAFVG